MPEESAEQMSWLESYKANHKHPLNRLTHTVGIPMILISVPLVFLSWRWALGLFTVGWIFQFIGHAIEGNQPSFFRNPAYLLIGATWYLKFIAGKLTGQKRP